MPRARRTGTWAHTPIELPPGPRDAATNTALLQRVRERYDADRPHERFNTRHTNVVWGEGDPCAALMFVGEAPGENEDLTGRPFVGRAGELLTKMIGAMGLSRESVYIANIVKVRPPDNATPTIEEAEASAPYLFDQIRVIAPKVIVTLGLPSTRALLATGEAMRDLRGKFFDFPPPHARRTGAFAQFEDLPTIPVMPTYHPAYLLRSYTPENRQKAWSDLQQVMERLGLARPGPV
jgi:DNA polymerase